MFNPTTTINVPADWMLQSVQTTTSKQRAQALNSQGNEHSFAQWGERTTEQADFTLGGKYEGNIPMPSLGSGVTDFALTYSETEYPTLSVSSDDAAGGASWSFPEDVTFPARTIGCPSAIPGIYSGLSAAKQVTIAVSCQHVEEPDGNGEYGTYNGMRDCVVTVTITGVAGKPTVTFDAGWSDNSASEGNSNTALATGSVVYEKHFPITAA
jgi:hypothetical protein